MQDRAVVADNPGLMIDDVDAVKILTDGDIFKALAPSVEKAGGANPRTSPARQIKTKSMNLMEDRRLNKRAIGFACLLLDRFSTHDALQSREAEHACRITLVIGAGRGDDSRSTVLDIDYHHVPYRPTSRPSASFTGVKKPNCSFQYSPFWSHIKVQ